MPALHATPFVRTYHANRCSCASCCTILYVVACTVLPYVIVYALGGMWTKEVPVREQPLVVPRHEVIVEAHASAVEGGAISSLIWSTSKPLNDAAGARYRPCDFRSWVEDDENDGFPDRLQYAVTVPVDAMRGERMLSISVVVGLDVTFAREFQLRMNSSLIFQASSPLPGRAWTQVADLELHSAEAQRSLDLPPRSPCPEPVWAFRQPVAPDGQPASTATVQAQYERCNDTAVLAPQPPLWTPGVATAFEAHLTVRVPAIVTARRPGLVETLKLAAVQYIAFFLPTSFLLSCLHGALFRFGVVSARVRQPTKMHAW